MDAASIARGRFGSDIEMNCHAPRTDLQAAAHRRKAGEWTNADGLQPAAPRALKREEHTSALTEVLRNGQSKIARGDADRPAFMATLKTCSFELGAAPVP
jgi:hypothetical protein